MKLANGYGSIYKLSGNRRNPWIVRLPYLEADREAGQKRKILGYYHTKKEALTALADYHRDPTEYLNKDITVKDLYNLWADTHFKNLSECTKKSYKTAFRHLEPIHNITVNNIRLYHLQNTVDKIKTSPAKNVKILLGLIFNYAVMNDICVKNYAKGISIAKSEPQVKRTVLTQEEIDLLWKHKENIYAKYCLIQIYTGMRIGEVLVLKKDNVHLDERYMIGGLKTKAGKNRTIPICKKLMPIIQELYSNCTSDRLLNDYRTVPTIIKLAQKFRTKIGFQTAHGSHDFRYTFASLMDTAEVPLLITQKIMGHSARNLTQDLYTKKNLQSLLEAVDKL